jgi:hypothetical protein
LWGRAKCCQSHYFSATPCKYVSCSFLLHAAANLICILVSRQLVICLALPKFLHSFCGQNVLRCHLKNFISFDVGHFLSLCLRIQILHPYTGIGRASALGTFILEDFWTQVGLKGLYTIPSIGANLLVFADYPFSFPYEISQPRCLKFFTCCKHLLSTMILRLAGSCLNPLCNS